MNWGVHKPPAWAVVGEAEPAGQEAMDPCGDGSWGGVRGNVGGKLGIGWSERHPGL